MLDHNEATHNGISLGAVGDDEDTDISMQLARHGDMVMAMSDDSENGRQQHRHHDDGTLALECTIGDVGLNNDSIDNGQNFDVDEQDNEDDFTEPTSLQKYQMNKMGTLVGADGRKSPAGSRWHPGAYCANDAILLDDTIWSLPSVLVKSPNVATTIDAVCAATPNITWHVTYSWDSISRLDGLSIW